MQGAFRWRPGWETQRPSAIVIVDIVIAAIVIVIVDIVITAIVIVIVIIVIVIVWPTQSTNLVVDSEVVPDAGHQVPEHQLKTAQSEVIRPI